MIQKILLATTVAWPSAARLAGAFAGLGCQVEAVFPRGHVLGVSRYVSRDYPYRPLRPQASFRAAIAAAKPDIVIPCDDRALGCLLSLYAAGFDPGAAIARSLGCVASYPAMRTRSRSIAIAREEGVLAPLTIPVADEGELVRGLETIDLPAVLKTDGSWGGDGVAVVCTRDEASAAFRKLKGPPSRLRSVVRIFNRDDLNFLHHALTPKTATVHLQRFVQGRPATSAFACRGGEVLAAIHMDVVDSQGATGPASLLKRVDCGQMDNAVRRIAARFQLSGLHGLDFVRDKDGAAHLIEVNPRATQICHLALGAGQDLPAALLGLPPRPAATDKTLIALFPQAWQRDGLGSRPAAAYEDVPWDDPLVVHASIGTDLPDALAAGPEGIAQTAATLRPRGSES